MSTHESPPVKAGLPLLALAVGAFGIGVTEFSPMGLLPVIADGCLLYTSPSPRDS